MSNQNIDVERQKEIEKREEASRATDIAWYNLLLDQKVTLINLIVTRNGRLDANGRSVKDASHDDLIQEAKKLNYALDQEDRKIWKEHLSTSSKTRKNKGRYKMQKTKINS